MNRPRIALALIGDPERVAHPALDEIRQLAAQGYAAPVRTTDPTALVRSLRADPPESIKLIDYTAYFGALPSSAQAAVRARWGAPEGDPTYIPGELDCGAFILAAVRSGPIAVGLEPRRGPLSEPPPHAFFAFQAWLRDEFRADRIIPVGAPEDVILDDQWRRLALGPLAPRIRDRA